MKKGNNTSIDHEARTAIRHDRMDDAESDRAWDEIQWRLEHNSHPEVKAVNASSPARRPIRIIALGVAAVATAALGIALLPGGEQRDTLISLESASAAKVLDRSATGARDTGSLVPGQSEVLYFRSVQYPEPEAEPDVLSTEEWIDADGSGLRRERVATPAGKPLAEPTTTRFSDNPAEGSELEIGETWRAALDRSDLKSLPSDAPGALAMVRESAEALKRNSSDQNLKQLDTDFLGTVITIQLLCQAPLDGSQRAALFEVLETAPQWFRSTGGIPLKIKNLGATETREGKQGITIGVTLDLLPERATEPSYSTGLWTLEIVLDPAAGHILETRENEPESAGPTVTSYESLKLTAKSKSPL